MIWIQQLTLISTTLDPQLNLAYLGTPSVSLCVITFSASGFTQSVISPVIVFVPAYLYLDLAPCRVECAGARSSILVEARRCCFKIV